MSSRDMPQVSENDGKKILIGYKNGLEELYAELKIFLKMLMFKDCVC